MPQPNRFDLYGALLGGLLTIGLYANQIAGRDPGVFFAPARFVFYGAVAVAGAFYVGWQRRAQSNGQRWLSALPYGYRLALLGVGLCAVGAGFDYLGYAYFRSSALQVSLFPARLLIALGAVLVVTAPLRAQWHDRSGSDSPTWNSRLPVILSLLCVLSLGTLLTAFDNPFSQPPLYLQVDEAAFGVSTDSSIEEPALRQFVEGRQDVGFTSDFLVTSALTLSIILFGARRWRFPRGFVTFVLTVNAAAMFALDLPNNGRGWPVLLAAVGAGVLGDSLLMRLKPFTLKAGELRLFSFAVPFAQTGLFFVLLALVAPLAWPLYAIVTVVFLTGFAGMALSYLVLPPMLPLN